ncbi:hypothetical protein B4O97_08885 [Marispirochaeta aestuarii]|uniref:Endonuclease GajA/Old nuclease/RecF-like AAA domain-containing protein n=1 Tax=Marispirochaeta aestuarii TaxID=1963862 RepID=A0A1Y1RYX9_9SPIO|nr:AAA family ATPase [Marispirochaeta aestuarii]ORC35742.1 hypothetical protein B4O97_08885 [Marispirochaeta aestuarii]
MRSMKLTKIVIENYKSIKYLEIDCQKYGDSHTTMLIGVNESGKSNILQAISMFRTPSYECDYDIIHNQKDEENNYVDLWFNLQFDSKNEYLKEIREMFKNGDILDFEIKDLVKNVYLGSDDKNFNEVYHYSIVNITSKIKISEEVATKNVNGQPQKYKIYKIEMIKENDANEEELSEEVLKEIINNSLVKIVKSKEPKVSFWKPSEEYLISNVKLEDFKNNPTVNIPLRNIFAISGYKTKQKIADEINRITNDQLRRKMMTKLSKATTRYIQKIWRHNIEFDIEINDSKLCVVSVKDSGSDNQYNFHKMTNRSEGFKQFISLILSLSIETRELNKENDLILIDEPEAHLHPSGIRDLREELLEIGKTNYLFIATHSPFLVDFKRKERNIIVKKGRTALTELQYIKNEQDLRDDEVLEIAFGINIYKDLLLVHT